jgi:ABC-type Fe3+/spermidine/putrescine transport system ATPase subunit
MDAGRVVETGAPIDVFSRPRRRYTAEFLGLANVIPVTTVGRELRTAFGDVIEVAPPAGAGPAVAVALRPDAIRMVDRAVGSTGTGTHAGTVTAVEYQPGGVLHEVRLTDGTSVQVVVAPGEGVAVGAPVDLTFEWKKAVPLVD